MNDTPQSPLRTVSCVCAHTRSAARIAACAGCLALAARAQTDAARFENAARACARALSADAITALHDAACLDVDSGAEHTEQRRSRRQRQRELRAWFDAHGRNVTLADCQTAADRANYRDFRTVMASERLLAMPARRRRRIVRDAATYFVGLEAHLFSSLVTTLGALPAARPDPVRDHVSARLRLPVHIVPAFLGQHGTARIAALYHAPTHTMYLDLNALAETPAACIDAFEHELWHHLLPGVTPDDVTPNIWWEGFNEALAELWSAEYRRRLQWRAWDPAAVEYPVQTALASLYLGTNRRAALCWLSHGAGADAVAVEFTAAGDGDTAALRHALPAALRAAHRPDPERCARLSTLLGRWGWRTGGEDRCDVSRLINAEGLDAHALECAFRANRALLTQFSDALAVLALQDLCAAHDRRTLRQAAVDLPDPLRRNLRRVLNYIRAPAMPLPAL